VKHARAERVEVRLDGDAEGITLELRDDGIGFDPGGTYPGHLGLQTMRERAVRLGGSLSVDSTPQHGTRIRAFIPSPVPRAVEGLPAG
jgi:signal transduction histidine kinase